MLKQMGHGTSSIKGGGMKFSKSGCNGGDGKFSLEMWGKPEREGLVL